MGFNFNHFATVTHINIRKQGNDDNKQVAIDVKLLAEKVGGQHLCPILGVATFADIANVFWDANTDDKNIRLTGIDSISSWAIFQKGGYILKFGKQKTYVEKIHKFKIMPVSGQCANLEFTVTINSPQADLIDTIADHMQELVKINIEAPQELDLEGEAA